MEGNRGLEKDMFPYDAMGDYSAFLMDKFSELKDEGQKTQIARIENT